MGQYTKKFDYTKRSKAEMNEFHRGCYAAFALL